MPSTEAAGSVATPGGTLPGPRRGAAPTGEGQGQHCAALLGGDTQQVCEVGDLAGEVNISRMYINIYIYIYTTKHKTHA